MKRVLAVLLAALALAPAATGAPAPSQFPDDVKALLPRWVSEAETEAGDALSEDAITFRDRARVSAVEGRVRATMFDLETFLEVALAERLIAQAAPLASDADRKSFILQRADAWAAQSESDWRAYRERLAAIEDEFSSVRAVELALYSGEIALNAKMIVTGREHITREFPKQPTIDRGYVIALVRSSYTSSVALEWADDILDVAGGYEGLPPALEAATWADVQAIALADPGFEGRVPTHLQDLEAVGEVVRAGNESVMSVVVNLAEQRAGRAQTIFIMYGDAQSRGRDVVGEAARNMRKQLNNTTLDDARDHGLLGVFTADAIDRGLFTAGIAEQGLADLNIVIAAWSNFDHAAVATTMLSAMSPVEPAPPAKETPAPGALLLVAVAGALAVARRRR